MDVSGATSYRPTSSNTSNTTNSAKATEAKATETTQNKQDDAYVLETGKYENNTGKIDNEKIKSMWNEVDAKTSQLTTLANALFSKQGTKSAVANDLATNIKNLKDGIKNGTIKVDDETVAQAKKDIAEDGYYGVEQTSDRLVDFAKALSGGDPKNVEKMRDAIIKGFGEAEKLWGEALPQISKDTFNATMDKIDSWAAEKGVTLPAVERM